MKAVNMIVSGRPARKSNSDRADPRAEVLAEDHPAVAQLNDAFGDHTFFLNEEAFTDWS
jgi:hypothetical protein